MKFELDRHHRNIPSEELLTDLKIVASELERDSVTIDEYNERGEYHSSTLVRRFGSWFKVLDKAGLKKTRNLNITDEELFKNLHTVWGRLGRQPKYQEMHKPLSKYSAGTYDHRFGGWRKALETFVEYVTSEAYSTSERMVQNEMDTPSVRYKEHRTKRAINWRLRFLVLRRDSFKCKICGRSPATNPEIQLEVDHIQPYSKGGETVLENLQTLCSRCNVGKSDLALRD